MFCWSTPIPVLFAGLLHRFEDLARARLCGWVSLDIAGVRTNVRWFFSGYPRTSRKFQFPGYPMFGQTQMLKSMVELGDSRPGCWKMYTFSSIFQVHQGWPIPNISKTLPCLMWPWYKPNHQRTSWDGFDHPPMVLLGIAKVIRFYHIRWIIYKCRRIHCHVISRRYHKKSELSVRCSISLGLSTIEPYHIPQKKA
jgi:hypothetical protein